MNNFKKRAIAGILGLSFLAGGLSGCSKTADCDIKENHAHKYINSNGQVMYIDSEKEEYKNHKRMDDYILLDEKEEKLREFELKNGLYRIEENIEYINPVQDNNSDFVEYRYSYLYMLPIPHTIYTGKTTSIYFTYIPLTGHNWTADKNHGNLTGEERLVHNVYYGYKIETDGEDKLVVLKSKYVDDINDLSEEYKYIKKDFCDQVDASSYSSLDYEDGPESEHTMPDEVDESEIEQEKGQIMILRRG